MFEVASQAIKLPDDKRVAPPQGFEADFQTGSVIMAFRGTILVHTFLVDASIKQGITLQAEELSVVRFGVNRGSKERVVVW